MNKEQNFNSCRGHSSDFLKRIIFTASVAVLLFLCCLQKQKFQIGDYVMPIGKIEPQAVLKIVGKDKENYVVFEHYLVDGRLTQIESYVYKEVDDFEKCHIKIEQPKVEGSFSPDKFISRSKSLLDTGTGIQSE
jgi:hypothetical protein